MILPGSHLSSVILLTLAFLCLGAWSSTYLAAGRKWRYELYCYDFAVGVFLASIIAALTLGSMGWDGFSFLDDVRLAGKRQDVFAFASAMIFNLGNMLLLGAISLVGISVAFPIAIGFSIVIGAIAAFFIGPAGSALNRGGGVLALIAAICVITVAYRVYARARLIELIQSGRTKSTRQNPSSKGIVVSLVAGLFLGLFYPLMDSARQSEIGLGPYSLGFVFAAGIIVSTFVYNLFFMNLPIHGKPIELAEYFKAKARTHLLGILGGMIWFAGAVCTFVVERVAPITATPPWMIFALTQGSLVVAMILGLVYWKELRATDTKISYQVILTLVFVLIGIGLMSTAPIFVPRA
jgi:glucose uptake protein